MNNADKEYLKLVKDVLQEGVKRNDRTGTGVINLFGTRMEFDLSEGFPLLTTKRVPFRVVAEELFWFLSGSTDLKDLLDRNVKIWNKDGYRFYLEKGGKLKYEEFLDMVKKEGFDMGPIYGASLRSWKGKDGKVVDQVATVLESLKNNPNSRRHVITTWNPTVLDEIALPSCHGTTIQFSVTNKELSCQVYIRSNDLFLGAPFNIASYALLTHIMAKMLGYNVGKLVYIGGESHIYLNHVEQVKEQLTRKPKKLPTLSVKTVHRNIEDYTMDDIELVGYDPHPTIKGRLSVGL